MQGNQRRVNKLLLNLGLDSQRQLAVARLEDAFKTASLPGLPPSRLVLIRRLELGRLADSCSNMHISNTIDAAVRQLAATAVCVDTQPDTDANVVWFQDELQAYLVASLRLATGKTLDQWYWLTLLPDLPEWQPGNRLLEVLLQSAQIAVSGPMSICRYLLQHACLDTLLSRLESRHAVQLLQLAGFTPDLVEHPHARPYTAVDKPLALASHWIPSLGRWISRWSENDARAMWLFHCALLDANPARGINKEITVLHAAIGQFVAETKPAAGQRPEARTTRVVQGGEDRPILEVGAGRTDNREGREDNVEPIEASSAKEDENDSDRLVPSNGSDIAPTRVAEDPVIPSDTKPTAAGQDGLPARHRDGYLDYSKLAASGYAGLPFVVPLLEHLGIVGILNRHEHAVEIDLPAHLLWSVAKRFKMDESDPAVAFLPDSLLRDPQMRFEFAAPADWLTTIQPTARPRLLTQPHEGAARHVLTDSRERVVFAIWYEQPPASLSDWLDAASEQVVDGVEIFPDLQLVAASFHLMMGALLRSHCAMSLRRLVQRPGKIATTNTHVDCIFNANQVDMRLRRTGLDTNPGWVPWLGKVVQFHYEYDDAHYF